MLSRRMFFLVPMLVAVLAGLGAQAQGNDPLPSWNDGPAKRAILDLVRATTEPGGPDFVAPEDRLATFDQDGTLWVEHPVYSQVVFALDRVAALAPEHPEWKDKEPFKTVLSGDREAMARLSLRDLEEIVFATHAGMSVEAFTAIAAEWAGKARDRRWDRPYTELVYQPMLEVLELLRASGYRTYIVTGGGQDFVRSYAERVYGVGPAQVIGSTLDIKYGYDAEGEGVLLREPKLELDNNNSGKAEDIQPRRQHLLLGRRALRPGGRLAGQHLAGRVPAAGQRRGRLPRGRAGRLLRAERLRPGRHDRQCLGVRARLVAARASGGARHRSGRPAGGPGRAARRRGRAFGSDQGRLLPVRAQLLRPLPPVRAPAAGAGPRRLPSRLPHRAQPAGRARDGAMSRPTDPGGDARLRGACVDGRRPGVPASSGRYRAAGGDAPLAAPGGAAPTRR